MDISARFDRYLKNISPSDERLKRFQGTINHLKERLQAKVKADGKFHLETIYHSGSVVKQTSVIYGASSKFDVDLAVYFRSQGKTDKELDKLLTYTHICLGKIYPNKLLHDDIHKGKNAINLTFRTRKLKVDVVPIIRTSSELYANSGDVAREDKRLATSITAHIYFIHERNRQSKKTPGRVSFNNLVRLVKVWNKRLPVNLRPPSYFCELVTSAAFDECGITDQWQSSLLNVFSFIESHAFKKPIIFNDYYQLEDVKPLTDPVVVLDAVNPENNVARKWTLDIKRGYLKKVHQAMVLIREAQECENQSKEEEALKRWCKVFGKEFRRLSQE